MSTSATKAALTEMDLDRLAYEYRNSQEKAYLDAIVDELRRRQALPDKPAPASAANATQVGGSHYAAAIQHWDFVAANGLGYFEGQVTKYVARWRKKNGIQDLHKARHFLAKLIELAEAGVYAPDPDWPVGREAGTRTDSATPPPETPLPSYPGNGRKDNGQLVCGCWGVACGGHEPTNIGEAL